MGCRVIETSLDERSIDVSLTWKGHVRFRAKKDGEKRNYLPPEIADIQVIDEEQYRSVGKAALTAVAGGVLTGGIGLVAGAIIGGRRRRTSSYFVKFADGEFIAMTETRKSINRPLGDLILKRQARALDEETSLD